ncbi:HAD-IA family hydrolase [bacterium]|nr:HAD-IA family hydrolase [bacterium]
MKKLFIFDCDGTLIDSEILACQVLTQAWAEHGVHVSPDEFLLKVVGKGGNDPFVQSIHSRLGPEARRKADEELEQEFEKNLAPVRGIKAVLDDLIGQLCVASNSSPDYVFRALKNTGLDPYFEDRVFSSHQLKKPKPAPDLFLHALKILQCPAKEAIVIEDSASGILAAQNAGVEVVAFMGGRHFKPENKKNLLSLGADHYCHDTNELRAVLFS